MVAANVVSLLGVLTTLPKSLIAKKKMGKWNEREGKGKKRKRQKGWDKNTAKINFWLGLDLI